MTYLYLFLEFFKTGLFAVGGGMATIPFLYEIARKYDWYSTSQLIDMIAVSQATPGPVGVNMATFAGFLAGSFAGSVLATFALVLPSYIIVVIIARMLQAFKKNVYVQNSFLALRPAVVGLLFTASCAIFQVSLFLDGTFKSLQDYIDLIDYKAWILFALLFAGIIKFKKHPVLYIVIGAVAGVLFNL